MTMRPTQQQQDQAMLVQHDIAETMNRLGREGIDPRIIMAGVGAAVSDMVTCILGPDEVPRWFAQQALTTKAMLDAAG